MSVIFLHISENSVNSSEDYRENILITPPSLRYKAFFDPKIHAISVARLIKGLEKVIDGVKKVQAGKKEIADGEQLTIKIKLHKSHGWPQELLSRILLNLAEKKKINFSVVMIERNSNDYIGKITDFFALFPMYSFFFIRKETILNDASKIIIDKDKKKVHKLDMMRVILAVFPEYTEKSSIWYRLRRSVWHLSLLLFLISLTITVLLIMLSTISVLFGGHNLALNILCPAIKSLELSAVILHPAYVLNTILRASNNQLRKVSDVLAEAVLIILLLICFMATAVVSMQAKVLLIVASCFAAGIIMLKQEKNLNNILDKNRQDRDRTSVPDLSDNVARENALYNNCFKQAFRAACIFGDKSKPFSEDEIAEKLIGLDERIKQPVIHGARAGLASQEKYLKMCF